MKNLIVLLFITLPFSCVDVPDVEKHSPFTQSKILQISQSSNHEQDVYGDDGPSQPFILHFPDVNRLDGEGIDVLEVEIENISKYKYDVVSHLKCDGLGKKTAKQKLGTLDFNNSDALQTLAIRAEDMPIQQISGAASCQIELELSYESSHGVKKSFVLSPEIYVQHSADYSKMKIFDEKQLVQKYGGKLSGTTRLEKKSGDKIGRIKTITALTEVVAFDESTAVWSDGERIGWDVGFDVAPQQMEEEVLYEEVE